MINLNKYYISTEYQGASGGSEGRSGFVPKALSGDETKFLRGDGTWQIATTTSIPTTGIHIPAPTLKWQRTNGPSQVLPDLFVSYTPTLTSTWLTPQTEVWIFVYRKPKRKKWLNSWSGDRYVSGYVHPVDVNRGTANGGKPLYAGDTGGKVFHTEFSFTSGEQLPQPYQQVPLTAFNPLEFYSRASSTASQISATDFPFDWDTGNIYDIFSPRMSSRTSDGKNLTTYYQFKFAIPNPDSTSKYPKLFGPPAYLKVRPKFTDGLGRPVTRGSAGSYIQFMNYASDNK
jgi:hypothetical protein